MLPGHTDWKDERSLQFVLQHEYVHIRRYDAAWKLAAVLAVCMHWFNPAAWLMYVLLSRDMELSCDEGVVRKLGGESSGAYALTLIEMEEKKSGLAPFCYFSKNAIVGITHLLFR